MNSFWHQNPCTAILVDPVKHCSQGHCSLKITILVYAKLGEKYSSFLSFMELMINVLIRCEKKQNVYAQDKVDCT